MARRSPLQPLHEALLENSEGSVRPYGPPDTGANVVETFGPVELEYAALRKACALIDLPQRATLEITGSERLAFLNSMVTGELGSLTAGRSCRAFWLSKRGRITADMRLTEAPGGLDGSDGPRMYVDLDALAAHDTVETLGSYIIMEDAEIGDITESVHRLALHGPTAPLLLDGLTDADGISRLENGSAALIDLEGAAVLVEREDTAGTVGLELTIPAARAEAVYRLLLTHGQVRQPDAEEGGQPVAQALLPEPGSPAEALARTVRLRPAGWFAYNIARIEAGTPLFNIDFGVDTLPHETGPDTLASRVSFTKGCYLGQEVVSRMHHLGRPKQQLVALKPEGEELRDEHGQARQPLGGAHLYRKGDLGGEQVGIVTSSTISPMLGGDPICFAMVKQAAAAEGTELDVAAEGVTLTGSVRHHLGFL